MKYYNMQQKLNATNIWLIAVLLSLSTGLLNAQPTSTYAELEKKVVELDDQSEHLEAIRVSHRMLQAANDEFGRESEEYRVVLYNLGYYYRLTNQLNQAETYYERATKAYLTIYDQPPEMPDGGFPPNRRRFYRYEDCLVGLAKTYKSMGDSQKAEELYLKVLDLSQDRRWDVIYWQHLKKTADFYIEQDRYAEGIKYLEKNLALIKEYYTTGKTVTGIFQEPFQLAMCTTKLVNTTKLKLYLNRRLPILKLKTVMERPMQRIGRVST